jgi:N-acetyl sugar amidotransferase
MHLDNIIKARKIQHEKGVVVNGHLQNIPYQICSRCCQDSTVPHIHFDEKGVCNYCHFHDMMEDLFPNGEKGKAYLSGLFEQVKKKGKGKKYDCVAGISGGRDSIYLLYFLVRIWGLRPLAVHFNDGFDNPVAGENMVNACRILGVELRTITSDWREAKQLKIDFLKASTPDLNMGTDIGIASSLYSMAAKENVKYVFIGQSFRTEGIKPLTWSFFDGDYLRNVHYQFSDLPLRKWSPNDAGFNLGVKEMAYYTFYKGIHTYTPLYYWDYIRPEAQKIIETELEWVYPGAHYFDDLYHSLIKYVHRVKFNIDMNMNSDAALVRSGFLSREEGIKRAHGVYQIEDPKVIDLCIKRLGITRADFDSWMALPPKTFLDYKTMYNWIRPFKFPIKLASHLNFLPKVAYYKYFELNREPQRH